MANGDPSSHEPDLPVSPQRARRTTFNGLARLIVQVWIWVGMDIGCTKLMGRACICSGLVMDIASYSRPPDDTFVCRRLMINLYALEVQVTGQAGQVLIEVSSDNLKAIEPTTIVVDSEPEIGLEAQGVLTS